MDSNKEVNIRYGVVNTVKRSGYEKEFHVPYGYHFISYRKFEAISNCKNMNDSDYIVERIFDTFDVQNKKEEIFRSGSFKEGEDEKND